MGYVVFNRRENKVVVVDSWHTLIHTRHSNPTTSFGLVAFFSKQIWSISWSYYYHLEWWKRDFSTIYLIVLAVDFDTSESLLAAFHIIVICFCFDEAPGSCRSTPMGTHIPGRKPLLYSTQRGKRCEQRCKNSSFLGLTAPGSVSTKWGFPKDNLQANFTIHKWISVLKCKMLS